MVIPNLPRLKDFRATSLLVLSLTLLAPSFALDSTRNLTQYLHRIWQSPQGLPPAEIRSILQASDGYIWLGTSAGVQRFDGIRFTPLPGMTNDTNPVEQIIEDSSGNVWIATTQSGLFEYSGIQLKNHFSRSNGLPSDSVLHLAAGPQGRIWAALADGEIVQIANGRISSIPNNTPVTALSVDSRGIVWIGGDQASLRTWDGARFENFPLPKSTPADATVQSLFSSADSTLWVGTSRGLLHIASTSTRFFTKANGLAGNSILAIIPNSDGGVWIGTNEGFSRAKNGEIESFGAKQGLSQSTVYALAEDREGHLWVGTKRGLNQFLDRRTIPFTTAEGLPTNDVGPVFEDAAGSLWVGTLGQGLARKIHNGFTVMGKSQGLSNNFVEALGGSPDGSLWIGTSTGLDHLRDGKVESILRQSIRSLYRDRSGLLWAGTANGIAVLSDDHVILSRTLDSAVVSFAEDRAGHIYAATDRNGIQIFDLKNLAAPPRNITIIREAAALFADPSDGSIWAGTIGNGLYRLTAAGAKIEHFSANDGLFDDDIYGIAADDRGSLWMACSKGIFSVNRADLEKFSAG
ncbi:MAG TPA: two-component regulator propeller domain-containing protein, partial [Bryobacteraceae bacterium]